MRADLFPYMQPATNSTTTIAQPTAIPAIVPLSVMFFLALALLFALLLSAGGSVGAVGDGRVFATPVYWVGDGAGVGFVVVAAVGLGVVIAIGCDDFTDTDDGAALGSDDLNTVGPAVGWLTLVFGCFRGILAARATVGRADEGGALAAHAPPDVGVVLGLLSPHAPPDVGDDITPPDGGDTEKLFVVGF